MKKPVIHFISLFGVDYELDIMPYWVEHWKSHRLDSYHVYLHRENSNIYQWVKDYFTNAGFTITCVDGPHNNGILRHDCLNRYAMNSDPNIFIVSADADEFHVFDNGTGTCKGTLQRAPTSAPTYHDLLSRYDIISGFLFDHYGVALEACKRDPFEQYPNTEEFTGEQLKNFTPPFLRGTEWPHTRRSKILACRAGEAMSYMGSHCIDELSWQSKILDNQKVHHFAWRESAARKIAVKPYYKEENLKEIFRSNIPENFLKQYKYLQKLETSAVL